MSTARPSLRLIVTAVALMAFQVPVRADEPATRPTDLASAAPIRPGKLLESYGEILATLKLSLEQSDKARAAVRATRDAFRDRVSDPQASRLTRAESIRTALDQLDASINAVLTEEQRRTFAEKSELLRARLRDALRREAQRPPTSRPATQPAYEQRPGAPLAGRIERAIAGLGLTDAQRAEVFNLLDPARDRIDTMVAEATTAGTPQAEIDVRVRRIVEAAYAQVLPLLLQAQKERFEAQFRADRVATVAPLPTPAPGSLTIRDGTAYLSGNAQEMTLNGGGIMSGGTQLNLDDERTAGNANRELPRVANPNRPRGDPSPTSQPASTIRVGDPMPTFTLTRLNGTEITQRIFSNRPGVLIFGSLTSPAFRDRIPRLQSLADRYGNGVIWIVVYTREMHPGTGDADLPERNRDDHIELAAAANADDRVKAAKLAKQKLSIGFEVIPDSMDDALTNTFGTFPNGAAVFDASGKLVALERWAEPFAIKRALDRARGVAE